LKILQRIKSNTKTPKKEISKFMRQRKSQHVIGMTSCLKV